MERAVVYLGELNDGLEEQYPDSDVPRLAPYAHITTYQELTTRLSDQLSEHICIQGDPGTSRSVIGVSIAPGIGAEVEEMYWYDVTSQNSILAVHVNFMGCPMTVISCRRPTKKRPFQTAAFDRALSSTVITEKNLGRLPHIGMDTNEPEPDELADNLGLEWIAPYDMSITGFFVPTRYSVLEIFQLKKLQEHAPVVAITKVPLLNA